MRITTLTSREFSEDTGGAKKAAARGPVVITDGGRPAHVLMTYAYFQELTRGRKDIVSLLGMAAEVDLEFEPPKASGVAKEVDLE